MRDVAYHDGLRMLARRELSESQVRQRLARRGHDQDAVEVAVSRLKDERAIDDARVAEAIARTEVVRKSRGKRRVTQRIESVGIARSTARRAVDEAFSAIDEDSLLETALARRLRATETIADDAEFGRLYRYLVAQGFEIDAVMRALKARSVK